MPTCGIYARYSSDAQAETSIDDQLARGRARAGELGLTVVAEHADRAISGGVSVAARPGGKALLADVLAARWQVLLIESLDRLSRSIVDGERTVARIEARGIRIVGWSDGYDSANKGRKATRLVRGIVNELYRDDLAEKTMRGMLGRQDAGYHVAGKSYGYRSERTDGGCLLRIVEHEAATVRRIFDRYGAGQSVQRIAHDLNAEGVPSPRGRTWAVSAIYGSPAKGAGILNNELYRGRAIWLRSQWVRDPEGNGDKRSRLDRPRSEWRLAERPELRIVTDAQWQAVRDRMAKPRMAGGSNGKGAVPRTLWGGLLRCGHCGGAVVAVSKSAYGCAARKDRGPAVCQGVTVSRKQADARLLAGLRDDLLAPAAIRHVTGKARALLADAGREQAAALRARDARKVELEREIGRLVDAIAAAGTSPALTARLQAAEGELAALQQAPVDAAAPVQAARTEREIEAAYKGLTLRLDDAMRGDIPTARRLLADLLAPLVVKELNGEVWAEAEDRTTVVALKAAAGGGAILGRVAGAGFEPATFGL